MPWIPPNEKMGWAAYYAIPMSDGASSGLSIVRAKAHRAYWQRSHDELIAAQTTLSRSGDRETAKFLKEHVQKAQKLKRGFDAVVRWIEGHASMNYPTDVAEQISPYVDFAFSIAEMEGVLP